MSPALAGSARPAQKRLRPAEPNPTQPDPSPAQKLADPCRRVADIEPFTDPECLHPHDRRADGPTVSQPPNTRTLGFATPPFPGPPSPGSALTGEELRTPPRSFRQPLPPPPTPAPQPPLGTGVACPPAADSGPGNPPHGSASAPSIAPSER